MPTHDPLPRYRAYLLRCWQERGLGVAGQPVWRFSLADPHTGERCGFATWETLVTFLRAELCDESLGATRAPGDAE